MVSLETWTSVSFRVAKEEEHNKMSPGSLAIVFAPCILRSPDADDPFLGMKDVSKTTMWVISRHIPKSLCRDFCSFKALYEFPKDECNFYGNIKKMFDFVLQVCGDPDLWAVQALQREDAEHPGAGIRRGLGCQPAQIKKAKHGERTLQAQIDWFLWSGIKDQLNSDCINLWLWLKYYKDAYWVKIWSVCRLLKSLQMFQRRHRTMKQRRHSSKELSPSSKKSELMIHVSHWSEMFFNMTWVWIMISCVATFQGGPGLQVTWPGAGKLWQRQPGLIVVDEHREFRGPTEEPGFGRSVGR